MMNDDDDDDDNNSSLSQNFVQRYTGSAIRNPGCHSPLPHAPA